MADWYADKLNGDDTTGDGSEGNPYETIQKCVDSAASTDTVFVQNTAVYTEMVTVTDKSMNLIGYNTTTSDEGVAVVDGGSSRVNGIKITNTTGNVSAIIRNFEFKNCTGAGLLILRGAGGSNSLFIIDNIWSHDNDVGINLSWNQSSLVPVSRVLVELNTSGGIINTANTGLWAIIGSQITDNGGVGVALNDESFCADCTIAKNTINVADVAILINCTIDAADGTDGWVPTVSRPALAWKTAFTNSTAFGIDPGSAGLLNCFYCGFYLNTSGDIDGTPAKNVDPVTGSDPLYSDAAGFDFTLGSASPWKQIDGPIGDVAAGVSSFSDIGAIQLEVTGGGGSGGRGYPRGAL